MSSTIGATGVGSYATTTAASTGQAASPSRADHHTALNQVLYRHQVGMSRGESADMLASLDKPITAGEKALGQQMALRRSPMGPADQTSDTQHHLNATA
jgi:hypothetical protein